MVAPPAPPTSQSTWVLAGEEPVLAIPNTPMALISAVLLSGGPGHSRRALESRSDADAIDALQYGLKTCAAPAVDGHACICTIAQELPHHYKIGLWGCGSDLGRPPSLHSRRRGHCGTQIDFIAYYGCRCQRERH